MKPGQFSNQIILFILLFIPSLLIRGQFRFKSNLETGQFKSGGEFLSKESSLVLGFEGLLGYNYEKENIEAGFEIKTRPEYFAATKKISSLKFRGSGSLLYKGENINWGASISRQFSRISDNNLSIDYDLFSIQANLLFYLNEKYSLLSTVGYAYQNVSSALDQDYDFIFLDSKIQFNIENNLRSGIGFYLEKFIVGVERSGSIMIEKDLKKGLRLGPQLEVNYLHNFVLNGQYRFLLQFPESSSNPSIEHWLRLMAGHYIFDDLVLFLLIDYYKRSISDSDDYTISPFNRENYICLKASYELSENIELYFKSGYFQHNLFFNNITFEGWNYMMGIEINY